mmetsp:Transcript_38463/g.44787  ORF Transcript_38463/g.44787 Transcript_38463/m.44787 type:complete len:265 (-) Transcript_38463:65-859(-)
MLRKYLVLRAAMVPSTWHSAPDGWFLVPSTTVAATEELKVRKHFSFLKQNSQYNLLGQSMAFALELKVVPVVDWFYSELTFTLPPTREAEILACFLNDQEKLHCGLRNQTSGTSSSGAMWSPELMARVATKSEESFCWCLTDDTAKTQQFLQETLMQWHHRADYLVARKSREKKEFRQDITLTQVIQQGQERKRRMQQRKHKEEKKEEDLKAQRASEWDNFTADVLPREVREMLDRESDGMEDVRYSRSGSAVGGWGRRGPNMR